MQQLIENLYITDAQSARRLNSDHDFDEVVTLGYSDSFDYNLPEQSTTGDSFVFPDGPHNYYNFKSAADYVLTVLNRNDTVLVHCQAGVSRSTGVCAVVLVEFTDMSLPEALDHIRAKRPIVNPAQEIRESMETYTGQSLTAIPKQY